MAEKKASRSLQKSSEKLTPTKSARSSGSAEKKTSVRGGKRSDKKTSARDAASSDKKVSTSAGGDKSSEQTYNGFEAFVRKFPAGVPLNDAEGFKESNKQWQCFCLPVVVMTFVMALVNIGLGLLLLATGLHPLLSYGNAFADIIIIAEIVACSVSGAFALVNLFLIQRALVIVYALMQMSVAIGMLIGSIALTLIYDFAQDSSHQTTTVIANATASVPNVAVATTNSNEAGPSSVLAVMIFSYFATIAQFVKLVVACRYRQYLIIKRYARKSVNEN